MTAEETLRLVLAGGDVEQFLDGLAELLAPRIDAVFERHFRASLDADAVSAD